METNFDKALDMIAKAENILVLAHQSPDGDAVGSMVAIGLGLKQMGKNVDYSAGQNRYNLENIIEEMQCFDKNIKEHYDLAVVVDSSTVDYIHNNEYIARCDNVLIFDHHDTNMGYGNVNVLFPNAAACGEIIYDFLVYANVNITKEIAQAVFVAIVTDTGNFVYSNTTANCHKIVADIYEKYDDFYVIAEYLKLKPLNSIKMLSIGLNALHLYHNGRFIVSTLLYKDGFGPELDKNTDSLTDIIRYAYGVDVAVIARQIGEDMFKCSMRSSEDKYDVSKFSQMQGGGGHTKAAGFNYEGKIEDLLKLLEDYFNTL